MPTTLDLMTLSPTSLRWLVACCAKALDPETTTPTARAVWKRLRQEPDWVPTAGDCPLTFSTVQDWLATEEQEKLRVWLETHDREEGH